MTETGGNTGTNSEDDLRPWQFSLGGLLLLMTGFAVWMSLIGRELLAQGGRPAVLGTVVFLLLSAWIAGMWRIFVKAGQPGWGTIVPIYNALLLVRVAGWDSWKVIFLLIPGVHYFAWFIVCGAVALRFGKGLWYGVGLAFLPHIFFFLPGFGASQYESPPVKPTCELNTTS